MPLTRREYWGPKLTGNVTRDATVQERLRALGWQIMVVWECECEAAWLPDALRDFLGSPRL
jgi:DNA mismatch endonuclease (patch repair protein)